MTGSVSVPNRKRRRRTKAKAKARVRKRKQLRREVQTSKINSWRGRSKLQTNLWSQSPIQQIRASAH